MTFDLLDFAMLALVLHVVCRWHRPTTPDQFIHLVYTVTVGFVLGAATGQYLLELL